MTENLLFYWWYFSAVIEEHADCQFDQEPDINAILPNDMPSGAQQPPRAQGAVRLSVKDREGHSVIGDLRQSGSLKVLFPATAEPDLQAVLVNTAGGITGGDRFSVDARVESGTTLTLTTQAAERAYRAVKDQIGRQDSQLVVAQDARINWIPQETILYDGCALQRSLTIEMAGTAKLLFAEPVVFGRAAMGERLTSGLFQDRVDVRRDGAPLFLDATRLDRNIADKLARPAIAGGAGAMVSLLYVSPDVRLHLAPLRALLPDTGGASLLRDDVLFLRAVAPDSHELRQSLIPILTRLSGNALPRPWMI